MHPIDYFYSAADRFPDRSALIDGEATLTFGDLCSTVEACAAGLVAIDPAEQSHVGICAGTGIGHVIALLSTLAAGKTWIPLNPLNGDAELNRIIEFTEPSIVVYDAANLGRLRTSATLLLTNAANGSASAAGCDTLESLALRHRGAIRPAIRAPLSATQAIKFTGGTTGVPKGVMQPYRAWNACIVTQMLCMGYAPSDKYLIVAPITHGTSTYIVPMLGSGGSIVLPHATKPPAILDAIQRYRITTTFMPPTLIYAAIAEQRANPRDLSSLRHLIYSGAPMRAEKILEARQVLGNVIATAYGQTEFPQIATFMSPHEFDDPRNLESAGRVTHLTDLAILDGQGRRLPAGETGEIALRGELAMTGYWQQPQLSADTVRAGWLLSGDLGLMDERGYVYLKGRSREVIITGGFNVYPADVESVLGRHPAVDDCSVVGIEDEKWGEAIHAAVQLRQGHSALEPELTLFVRKALDPVKTPKRVHIFEQLPRSSVGKIQKSEIKRQIWQRLTEREL